MVMKQALIATIALGAILCTRFFCQVTASSQSPPSAPTSVDVEVLDAEGNSCSCIDQHPKLQVQSE